MILKFVIFFIEINFMLQIYKHMLSYPESYSQYTRKVRSLPLCTKRKVTKTTLIETRSTHVKSYKSCEYFLTLKKRLCYQTKTRRVIVTKMWFYKNKTKPF